MDLKKKVSTNEKYLPDVAFVEQMIGSEKKKKGKCKGKNNLPDLAFCRAEESREEKGKYKRTNTYLILLFIGQRDLI